MAILDDVIAPQGDSKAWFRLGLACRQSGNLNAALECFKVVKELHPENASAYVEEGIVLRKLGNLAGARASYARSLELEPDSLAAVFNLGNLSRDEGKLDEARAWYERALRLRPDFGPAHNNLGLMYQEEGRWDEAVAEFRKTVAITPGIAGAHVNIGNILREKNLLPDAIASYREAIQAEPDNPEAHHSLGLALLADGQFEAGWKESEWRLRCRETGERIGARTFPRPLWDGSAVDGKTILIYTEQGFGDAIQFSRYLPLVKERGARVIFGTYPALFGLFDNFSGVDRLVDITAPTLPAFDAYAALMSLPGIFKTTAASVPARIPYMHPDAALEAQWRVRLDCPGPKVGLVWASNTQNRIGKAKSLVWHHLEALIKTRNVTFVSLQLGEPVREVARANPGNVRDLGVFLADFAQTAAALASLDLLIAVDTAVAHLAGAMGKRVWVLLPFAADWRWLQDRGDSPWYPSMRLFRQSRPGDWDGVIRTVREELRMFVTTSNRGDT